MANKKFLGAVAMSAALAGGAGAGVLLGTPSLGSAQDAVTTDTTVAPPAEATTPPTTTADDKADHGPGRGRFRGGLGDEAEAAATALGLSVDDLRTKLEAGATLAEIAAEQGVDKQVVIDAMVAAATARIDTEAAARKDSLVERITALVDGTAPTGADRGPRDGGRFGRGVGVGSEAAATALGLSEDDLRAKLRAGSTLAEIAAEQGVDEQVVIDAMVAAASARIDTEVAEGDLSAEEAATAKAALAERITALMDGTLPSGSGGFGPGGSRPGRHGDGHGRDRPAVDDPDSDTDSSTTESSEATTS